MSPDLCDNLGCANCIGFPVHFKVLSVISKILHGTQPGYLQDCLPLRISGWIGWAHSGGPGQFAVANAPWPSHHGQVAMVNVP